MSLFVMLLNNMMQHFLACLVEPVHQATNYKTLI